MDYEEGKNYVLLNTIKLKSSHLQLLWSHSISAQLCWSKAWVIKGLSEWPCFLLKSLYTAQQTRLVSLALTSGVC